MFAKITNGTVDQYPYTVGDLRRDNPNVSFPKNVSQGVMQKYGMYPVGYQAEPDYDPLTHRIQHSNLPEREVTGYYTADDAPVPDMVGDPIYSGRWVITKTAVALTADQIADATAAKSKEVRKDRDTRLAATDFYALTDVTMNAAMTTYRQELRDITSHANFPYLNADDWPTKP